jgi:predicted nucleic acid-binding protein
VTAVVDSCGWIEYLTDGPLADVFEPYALAPGEVVVPTLVLFEVAKWVQRERDETEALRIAAHLQTCQVRALDETTALLAAELSLRHRLAMADAIIYAHARNERIELVTSDAHFDGLDGVRYVPKN